MNVAMQIDTKNNNANNENVEKPKPIAFERTLGAIYIRMTYIILFQLWSVGFHHRTYISEFLLALFVENRVWTDFQHIFKKNR